MQADLLHDRVAAGRALGRELIAEGLVPRVPAEWIVLALPRGGVPVAAEVARALKVPIDLLIVRKLGHPRQSELAMGALAAGGTPVLNAEIAQDVAGPAFERVVALERAEIDRRERVYRGGRPALQLRDKRVVLVDDGVATGATMSAAIAAVRAAHPASIFLAVPVAPADSLRRLARQVDEVVCLLTPEPFVAIGNWYREFAQLDDESVRAILEECWLEERSRGLG